MNKLNSAGMLAAALLLAFMSTFMPVLALDVAAQDTLPGVDTVTPEPPTPTATFTPTPTNTQPPATETAVAATETAAPEPTATSTPDTGAPEPPQEIPEPITVVLFGTGLAALSAAVARRKQQE